MCGVCTSCPGLCVFRWPVSWWLLRVSWSVQRSVLSCLRGELLNCCLINMPSILPYWPAIMFLHVFAQKSHILPICKFKYFAAALMQLFYACIFFFFFNILYALLTCMCSLFGMALCCAHAITDVCDDYRKRSLCWTKTLSH